MHKMKQTLTLIPVIGIISWDFLFYFFAEEAHDFNERFKRQARDNLTGIFGGKTQNGRNAIDNGNGGRGGGGRRAMGNGGGQPAGVGTSSSGYQRSNEPIITIPDDEEDEKSNR